MNALPLRRIDELVVSDPDIRGGEPVVLGTRVPVYLLADLVRQGATVEELLGDYPSVTQEGLAAALSYAAAHPEPADESPPPPWRDYPLLIP